jgi:hypothetical protein
MFKILKHEERIAGLAMGQPRDAKAEVRFPNPARFPIGRNDSIDENSR